MWWRSVSLPPLGLSIPREYDRGLGIGTWALIEVVVPGGLYPSLLRAGCVAGLGPRGGLGMLKKGLCIVNMLGNVARIPYSEMVDAE